MATPFKDLKPFPIEALLPAPSIGHNRPDPSAEAVREFEESLEQRDGFLDRCGQLIAASDRAVCHDQDTAGRCADLCKQIATAGKVIEDSRKTVKEPYLEAGRAVDNAAKVMGVPLQTANTKVKSKLDTYLREEKAKADAEQRRRDEARREAERAAADARAKAEAEGRPAPLPAQEPLPVAPSFEPAPVRGDYGSLATARVVWKHEITDITLAFMAVENNEHVRAAIDKAIAALVRSGVRKIDGVRVYEDQSVSIR